MSEQEAQNREDMLMNMYKLHAYIPNDAEGNPLTPFGNFCAGYEAATAEANKRIDTLESEVAELKFSIKCLVEKLNEERTQFSEYKKEWSINAQRFIEGDPKLKQQISQLQASNNTLREKLETALTSLRKYENGI